MISMIIHVLIKVFISVQVYESIYKERQKCRSSTTEPAPFTYQDYQSVTSVIVPFSSL